MNLLVDTHALLWFAAGDARLSLRAREMIESSGTTSYVSMATWWEVAIKCSLGKLALDDSLERFISQRVDEGFRILTVETTHMITLVSLPFHHRDPFDRLIICQAMVEKMPICTADEAIHKYTVEVIW